MVCRRENDKYWTLVLRVKEERRALAQAVTELSDRNIHLTNEIYRKQKPYNIVSESKCQKKRENQFWCENGNETWPNNVQVEESRNSDRWRKFIFWISTPEPCLFTLTFSHHSGFGLYTTLAEGKQETPCRPGKWVLCGIFLSAPVIQQLLFSLSPQIRYPGFLVPLNSTLSYSSDSTCLLFYNPKKAICTIRLSP